MIEIFNKSFKNKNNKKMIVAITIIVVISIIYLLSAFLLCKNYQLFKKSIFIIIFSCFSFILGSLLHIFIKWYKYERNIKKLIENYHSEEIIYGVVCNADTYKITIKELLYNQYVVKDKADRIIYVLYGIDISNIINKKAKLLIKNNILYAYEVDYE